MLPSSRSSSSPSWLDRLRSSRGLPAAAPDDNLDRFISVDDADIPNPSPGDGEATDCGHGTPVSNAEPPPTATAVRKKEIGGGRDQMPRLISSVLADLFVMDGPLLVRKLGFAKASRKQVNPRLCELASAAAGESRVAAAEAAAAVSPPSGENSVAVAAATGARPSRVKAKRKRGGACGLVSAVDGGGYSRTEVTVIDTSSSASWKSEKIIFRKGAAWKVRDKKVWSFIRKRRRKLSQMQRLSGEKEREKCLVDIEPWREGHQGTGANDASRDTDVHPPKRRPQFVRTGDPAAVKKTSTILRLKVSPIGKGSSPPSPVGAVK